MASILARKVVDVDKGEETMANISFKEEIKERQMLFNGDNIIALLAGRKTKTRRVMKSQPIRRIDPPGMLGETWEFPHKTFRDDESVLWPCPYGVPGDRLWVREAHAYPVTLLGAPNYIRISDGEPVIYKADGVKRPGDGYTKWRPSIFMPRWACRILLEVTDVRIERLHDITYEDLLAEGLIDKWEQASTACIRMAWRSMWDGINKKRGYPWKSNPWVWVVSFKMV